MQIYARFEEYPAVKICKKYMQNYAIYIQNVQPRILHATAYAEQMCIPAWLFSPGAVE
jgi:hypothetical protein